MIVRLKLRPPPPSSVVKQGEERGPGERKNWALYSLACAQLISDWLAGLLTKIQTRICWLSSFLYNCYTLKWSQINREKRIRYVLLTCLLVFVGGYFCWCWTSRKKPNPAKETCTYMCVPHQNYLRTYYNPGLLSLLLAFVRICICLGAIYSRAWLATIEHFLSKNTCRTNCGGLLKYASFGCLFICICHSRKSSNILDMDCR